MNGPHLQSVQDERAGQLIPSQIGLQPVFQELGFHADVGRALIASITGPTQRMKPQFETFGAMLAQMCGS